MIQIKHGAAYYRALYLKHQGLLLAEAIDVLRAEGLMRRRL